MTYTNYVEIWSTLEKILAVSENRSIFDLGSRMESLLKNAKVRALGIDDCLSNCSSLAYCEIWKIEVSKSLNNEKLYPDTANRITSRFPKVVMTD